jgi:hypothetical protein
MQKSNPFPLASGIRPGIAASARGRGPCRLGNVPLALVVFVLFAFLQAGGVPVTAAASQFNPPSLEGFTPTEAHDADGDGDGVKETHIQNYANAAGDSIFSMTTKGRVWAWSLDTKGESTGGPKNYVIRDSDCDGVFDEVYGLDDKFTVPDCLK